MALVHRNGYPIDDVTGRVKFGGGAGPNHWQNGTPRTSTKALSFNGFGGGFAGFRNGWPVAADGRIAFVDAGTTVKWQNGLPLDATNHLVVANGGTIAFHLGGLPFSAEERLVVEP